MMRVLVVDTLYSFPIIGRVTTYTLRSQDMLFLEDNLPFWNKLDAKERQIIQKGTIRFTSHKGKIVHEDREKCTGLLMVVSGQLRIFIIGPNGKEITLYRLFKHDVCVLSASCLIRDITFDVHVQAEKETTIIRIATESYKEVGKTNPLVLDFTNRLIASRFSDVMWIMEQVVFMRFDQRLALYLIEQSAIAASDTLLLTHDAIAKNLGSAREVVTRMLRCFQDEHLVSLSRGSITLLNHEKLSALAGET